MILSPINKDIIAILTTEVEPKIDKSIFTINFKEYAFLTIEEGTKLFGWSQKQLETNIATVRDYIVTGFLLRFSKC